MGFIDYHGTKEDRYEEVLEYARLQREEERKRLQDEKIERWLKEIFGEWKYSERTMNDTIKYVNVKYRQLCRIKQELLEQYTGKMPVCAQQLWSDFSIYVISRYLKTIHLDAKKKRNYYTVLASKVFKLENYTPAEVHYQAIAENPEYKMYFQSCFEVTLEKHFWKWLGRIGEKNSKRLTEFVNIYEQLTVLLAYYLYLCVRPEDDAWMRCLEVERQALEKIREDYQKNRRKEPNYARMQNPLLDAAKLVVAKGVTPKDVKFVSTTKDEYERHRRPQLDKEHFEELLGKQELVFYIDACRLLRGCDLPEFIDQLYKELILRMTVLQESIEKYKEVYQPELYVFYDYYIPEALQLAAIYLEYLDVGIGAAILEENEQEVVEATNKLLIAVNGKIDEIYKFASIEMKAKAKALESIMSQDGYVSPEFKIKKE